MDSRLLLVSEVADTERSLPLLTQAPLGIQLPAGMEQRPLTYPLPVLHPQEGPARTAPNMEAVREVTALATAAILTGRNTRRHHVRFFHIRALFG